jgi:hypothetical protein
MYVGNIEQRRSYGPATALLRRPSPFPLIFAALAQTVADLGAQARFTHRAIGSQTDGERFNQAFCGILLIPSCKSWAVAVSRVAAS